MATTQLSPKRSTSSESTEPPPKLLKIEGIPVLNGPLQPAFIRPFPSNIRTMTFTLPKNFQFLRAPTPTNVQQESNKTTSKPVEESQLVPEQQPSPSPSLNEEKIRTECKALIHKMVQSTSSKTPSKVANLASLKALLKGDPNKFLKLCLDSISEMEQSTNIESVKQEGLTSSVEFPKIEEHNLYDRLEPILYKAGAIIALLEDGNDAKKMISIFGKKAFDAVFEREEILGGLSSSKSKRGSVNKKTGNEFDADKVCLIARFMSWIITKPRCLTIEQFKLYEAELMKKRATGLDVYNFRYFKESILIKYGCDRRRQLVREMDKEESKRPKEIGETS